MIPKIKRRNPAQGLMSIILKCKPAGTQTRQIFSLSLGLLILLLVNSPELLAAGSPYQGWNKVQKDEVSFLLPPRWHVMSNPLEGLLLQTGPDSTGDQAFFSYVSRSCAPVPFVGEVVLEEKFIDQWAIMGRRFIESLGVNANVESTHLLTINNNKAYLIRYNVSNFVGNKGVCDFLCLMVGKAVYGFMGYSLREEQEDREVFDRIFHSVRIDESKVPTELGPRTIAEAIANADSTIKMALVGMPPGWEWKLKSVEMEGSGDSHHIQLNMALNREDTLVLTDGYALVIDAIKKGLTPNLSEIKCDMNQLGLFLNQTSMIFGAVTSSFLRDGKPMVKQACLSIANMEGRINHLICCDMEALLNAIQTNNHQSLISAITCYPSTTDRFPKKRALSEGDICRRFAVIVGISKYHHADKAALSNLAFADKDAQDFASLLLRLGWNENHIKLIVNEQATLMNIKIAMESWLTKAGPQDLIVLYWSGHGYPDTEDPTKVYLACYDTDVGIPPTGYRMDHIRSSLEEKSAKNVLVLADTCHAGKLMTRGVRGISIIPHLDKMKEQQAIPKGWIFMVGAESDRLALEHSSWSNGAFTRCLLEGLSGKADGYMSSGASDGVVTMGELRTYLSTVMPDETQKIFGVAKRPVIETNSGDPAIWDLSLQGR